MNRTRVTMPALLLAFLLGFGGCYTILKHPAGSSTAGHEYSQDYFRENCVDCHPDYHEYPYGFYYGYYPEYYFSNQRWGRYYVYPWWWDHYWYDGAHDEAEQSVVEGDPHLKTPRSRDLMTPPYIDAGSSSFQGSGGIGGGWYQKPGGTTEPAGEQKTESDGKTKVTATEKSGTSGETTPTTDAKKKEESGKKAGQEKKRPR